MSARAPFRTRALLIAALALATTATVPLTATGAPAGDDPKPASIRDGRGDGPGIDIKKTTIESAPQKKVAVVTDLYSFGKNKLNASELWLDTNAKNAGPEFRVLSFRANDGDGLQSTKLLKVTDFRDGGEEKKCKGLVVRYQVKDDLIKTAVPLSCLGRPDRIRYNAITWDFRRYVAGTPVNGVSDYSPKKGRLSAAWRTH